MCTIARECWRAPVNLVCCKGGHEPNRCDPIDLRASARCNYARCDLALRASARCNYARCDLALRASARCNYARCDLALRGQRSVHPR
ncbi:hypothetical protein GCM10010407_05600 [Rarobacter incanus]